MNIALLTLKGLLSAAFLMTGVAKLVGSRPLADQFREFRLPLAMMPVTGALEVAGAIGLWVEPFPIWAAAGLAALMIGAVAIHVKVKHPLSKSAPALILLVLSVLAAAGLWLTP